MDIGHDTHTEKGVHFATGEPLVIPVTHRKQKTAQYGSQYGQDIEPHGRYLTFGHLGKAGTADEGWGAKVTTTHDMVHFKSPLVLHHGGTGSGPGAWKRRLSDAYGGKKGKPLSRAVAKDGYDAIVTVDTYGRQNKKTISEMVDLTSFPFKARNPADPRNKGRQGQCYPWALAYVRKHPSAVLQQGLVTAPFSSPPHRYWHAWVVDKGVFKDAQTMAGGLGGKFSGKGYPAPIWLDLYKPRHVEEYEPHEAIAMCMRAGHYGPWHGPESTENPALDLTGLVRRAVAMYKAKA